MAAEVKSYDDLVVGLPSDNLTIVGLARKLADQMRREPVPSTRKSLDAEREGVKQVVRYRPATITQVWTTGISKHLGVESKAQLFTMDDGLSSNGVWLKAIDTPDSAPLTIVLDDKGRPASAEHVADRLNRGEQVLAVDLPFTGEAWKQPGTWAYQQMIYTTGTRPLGLEVAHLICLANQMKQRAGGKAVRLESGGIRTGVIALVAAAIEPAMFSEVVVRRGMTSLRYLVDKPVKFHEAPDLFCLDLYKVTDLDRLTALAKPASVIR